MYSVYFLVLFRLIYSYFSYLFRIFAPNFIIVINVKRKEYYYGRSY